MKKVFFPMVVKASEPRMRVGLLALALAASAAASQQTGY